MFNEIQNKPSGPGWEKVGESMVAKESKYIEDERSKEKFHTVFCHVQHKANEWAKKFNKAITEAPMLRPSDDEVSVPPPITFLKCSIYEYTSFGKNCGLLGEFVCSAFLFMFKTSLIPTVHTGSISRKLRNTFEESLPSLTTTMGSY